MASQSNAPETREEAPGVQRHKIDLVEQCRERTATCIKEAQRVLAEADQVLRSARLLPRPGKPIEGEEPSPS